jgi:hypothetical protein
MAMKRLILAATAIGIVLVAGVVAWFLWSLDARVARAIEEQGTRIVGTRVRVGSVHIDLAAGKGTIRGLRVANPEGYSATDAIALAQIELAIDARSLREQPFRITQVRVGDSTVNFEVRPDGGSNLEYLTRQISHGSGEKEPPAAKGEPQRIAIGEFTFAGGEMSVTRPDVDQPDRVELPDLEMHDLGGARGATGGEIGEQIARAFTRRAIAVATSHQVGRAVRKEVGDAAGDAAESILRNVLK